MSRKWNLIAIFLLMLFTLGSCQKGNANTVNDQLSILLGLGVAVNGNREQVTIDDRIYAQAYIKASNIDANDNFGAAIAVSGDTMVVGAPNEDSSQTTISVGNTASSDNSRPSAGAVYVFVREAGQWRQQAYIKPPWSNNHHYFGTSVAIDGDTLVVGATHENSCLIGAFGPSTVPTDYTCQGSGAAFVFARTNGIWQLQGYLKATRRQSFMYFGASVAIYGDTIAIGAPSDHSGACAVVNGSTAPSDQNVVGAGAVYVFSRAGIAWSPQAYLKSPACDIEDRFGASVAISGESIVVGAPLEDSAQGSIINGQTGHADNIAPGAGSAFVFVRRSGLWSQQAQLKASNPGVGDQFGFTVSISNNTIAIGAPYEDSSSTGVQAAPLDAADNSLQESGAVYLFERNGDNWSPKAFVKSGNPDVLDNFGYAVGIAGNLMIVGGPREDSRDRGVQNNFPGSLNNMENNAGAGYVYTYDGEKWSQTAFLKAPVPSFDEYFGEAVAVSGDLIAVAAPWEASGFQGILNGTGNVVNPSVGSAGAAYAFTRGR